MRSFDIPDNALDKEDSPWSGLFSGKYYPQYDDAGDFTHFVRLDSLKGLKKDLDTCQKFLHNVTEEIKKHKCSPEVYHSMVIEWENRMDGIIDLIENYDTIKEQYENQERDIGKS